MEIPFASSPRSSLGIEWELQLVDRETRQLRTGAGEILEQMAPGGEHPKAKHELFQSCVEVITGVCGTVGEAVADLSATVEEVRGHAEARGLGLMCAGTHPLTHWDTQAVSPGPRYEQLVRNMKWLAQQLLIFGVHVHVGVRSPGKAVPIVNALTQYVPHFLGLSASSPFWQGHDTGLASARSKVFEQLPTAGLPYPLDDWAEFELYMETLLRTKAIESIKEVWWDVRPHPGYGTVELRICDGLPTLREVGMAAALSQCLVDVLDRELDRGYVLPKPKQWVVRENKWRAARYGLDTDIIVKNGTALQPLREAILELVQELGPTAERLGCAEELNRIPEVLEGGAPYERQRAVAAASGGDLTAVVDALLAEHADDAPTVLRPLDPPVDAPAAPGAVPA